MPSKETLIKGNQGLYFIPGSPQNVAREPKEGNRYNVLHKLPLSHPHARVRPRKSFRVRTSQHISSGTGLRFPDYCVSFS